jgi:leucyl/phenylalanyl-tRNA--protein transferase
MDDSLNPQTVWSLYREGWFPMGDDEGITWYRPTERALFPISGIKVSRSLARTIRSGRFHITFDRCFREVMESCLRPTDNWITPGMIEAYTAIHSLGWAHSCEVWEGDALVGGIYGLRIGACFSAESMFHRATDASKVALWAMVERCRQCGIKVFDAQIMNPHLESLGAFQVSDEAFMCEMRTWREVATEWKKEEVYGANPLRPSKGRTNLEFP